MRIRNKFARLFTLLCTVTIISGCSVERAFHRATADTATAVQTGSGIENPLPAGVISKAIASSSSKTTPTKSAIASFFSSVTKVCVALGILSLLAGGALIYFGSVIPGVKCVVGGIALPVAAIWLNYHYGVVIWIACIASAFGFLWALHKYDPALLSKLVADGKTPLADAESEIATIKKKL